MLTTTLFNKSNLFLFLFLWFGFAINHFAVAQTDQQKLIDSLATQKAQEIVKFKLDSIKKANTKPAKLPPAITFQIGANGQFNAGNISRIILSSPNRFQYRHKKNVYKLNLDATYTYGEREFKIAENDLLANLNHSFWYEKIFYGIIFSTYEFSNLRGISNRYLGGAGLGWQIWRVAPEKAKNLSIVPYLSITNTIMYESTDFLRSADIEVWRNSTRILANISFFRNKLFFNNIIYLQPSLSDANFRASWNSNLRFPLHSWVSFQITGDYSYESLVLAGRQNSDTRILFGFTFGNL